MLRAWFPFVECWFPFTWFFNVQIIQKNQNKTLKVQCWNHHTLPILSLFPIPVFILVMFLQQDGALNLKLEKCTCYCSLATEMRPSHLLAHTYKYSHALPQRLWLMLERATEFIKQINLAFCKLKAWHFFCLVLFFYISKPRDTISLESRKEIQEVL